MTHTREEWKIVGKRAAMQASMGVGMNSQEIQTWLAYWGNAKMVDLRAILAFDQVHQARKFCACMRDGVFHPSVVTDLQIWNALCRMRAARSS